MRLSPSLARLAETLAVAARHDLSLGPEKVKELALLSGQLVAEAEVEWLAEPAFQLRTGASPRWCRRNFARYAELGQARIAEGRHQWHVSARLPKARPTDHASAVREIAQSFERPAA